jgi:predicted nucleic acid-binding protein
MIVVDSSVWIANLHGRVNWKTDRLRELAFHDELIIGDLVLAEVLRGARDELHAARIERDLRKHVVEGMGGEAIAIKAAFNYRFLRAAGFTIRNTVDMFIGTFCIERGHSLLHDDRDFDPMEKLLGLVVLS